MTLSRKILNICAAAVIFLSASATQAYTVDCLGGETVQSAIDSIGSSETIFIDGVCASQGTIYVRQNNLRIVGAGGSANKNLNIVEGTFLLQGAQYITISGITINSIDAGAVAANDISNVRIFDSVLNATGTNSVSALSLNTSRALLLRTEITATSTGGNANAVVAVSNAVAIGFGGNSFTANASLGVASAIQASAGAIAWISPTGSLLANGAESYALNINREAILRSIIEPLPGESTTAVGNIRILGGSGEITSLSQSGGSFSVIDGNLAITNADVLDLQGPLALRNSNLSITNSSISLDVASFHSSITTIDENSNVNGTLEQLFGSKVAVLGASHLDKLICDSSELGASFFTDVTSSIATIEDCDNVISAKSKKSDKSKKSNKSKK